MQVNAKSSLIIGLFSLTVGVLGFMAPKWVLKFVRKNPGSTRDRNLEALNDAELRSYMRGRSILVIVCGLLFLLSSFVDWVR
jgi:Na+-driven multidrug efflux pump